MLVLEPRDLFFPCHEPPGRYVPGFGQPGAKALGSHWKLFLMLVLEQLGLLPSGQALPGSDEPRAQVPGVDALEIQILQLQGVQIAVLQD